MDQLSNVCRLEPIDFAEAFGETPDPYVSERIKNYPFVYREVSREERDNCLLKAVQALLDPDVTRAGDQRYGQWEDGWGANLNQLKQPFDFSAIVPGYFGKHKMLRWRQEYIEPMDSQFQYSAHVVLQDWLFNKYFRDMDTVYEFGCGTGHNLFRVRDVNQKAALWGLDWTIASQKILKWLKQNGVDANINGYRFDLSKPDHSFHLEPDAGVYTVAALEQIGRRFIPFLSYLIKNRPKLCIHIEPIAELLDENNLMDYLSIQYFKRRQYLDGFLTSLRQMETEGKVRIHLARRTFIGSLFIEGYAVVVWSPV